MPPSDKEQQRIRRLRHRQTVSSPVQEKPGEGRLPSLFHLLKEHKLYPTKSLGQVFLADPGVITYILNLLQLTSSDTVVEIGAGPGLITRQLAEAAGRIIAIEIDHKFKDLHKQLFDGLTRPPEMIYEDARKVDYTKLLVRHTGRLVVFGNLPYQLTTDLILTVLSGLPAMSGALFMVEEEVSQRMQAKPGTKKYGTLSMASQLFGQWRLERTVSRSSFFPQPQVTSALMRLTPGGDEENKKIASDPQFHRFLTGLMQYRRKTLVNALKQSGIWQENVSALFHAYLAEQELTGDVRSEQLTPVQLGQLYCMFSSLDKACDR